MKVQLHVNRQNIARNKKGEDLPVFTAKTYKENRKGNAVEIRCKSTGAVLLRGVYRPQQPLNCGAVLWMECNTNEVEVIVE